MVHIGQNRSLQNCRLKASPVECIAGVVPPGVTCLWLRVASEADHIVQSIQRLEPNFFFVRDLTYTAALLNLRWISSVASIAH
jgi:hypothetical protein